jgi:hypothetical protein
MGSKYEWKLIHREPGGHRLWLDERSGRVSIADQSGDDGGYAGIPFRLGRPDETDDGVLFIDYGAFCTLIAHRRIDLNGLTDEERSWQRRHPEIHIPVRTQNGDNVVGVTLEFFVEGLLVAGELHGLPMPRLTVDGSCEYISRALEYHREQPTKRRKAG